jgi:hypothetical protein
MAMESSQDTAKVTGFEVSPDGTITTGFTYPRSMPLEALSRQIEGDSSQITRSLGLYSVEKPQKLEIADVLTVKIRRERPARKLARIASTAVKKSSSSTYFPNPSDCGL